ncbi:MAG TPA: methyltransferase domain-containing protein [Nitrospiria bacterium]|nr:methyltransferase domain-containing protein [Nitrospiria bacterium]HUK56442.1 methyltransferase domain-containing protein [Nitrospiria bacterium]
MSRSFIKGIQPGDLVLEIGSGHNPYPRSNILCDKHLENLERGGGIRTGGRPLVIADGESLPFPDKSFDFIICSHVLEHAEDPGKFLNELSRVGKAGYIETPSEVWEALMEPREYHRWFVISDGDGLVVKKKEASNVLLGKLYERLVAQNGKLCGYLMSRQIDVFFTRHYWRDRIFFRIIPPSEKCYFNYHDPKIADELIGRRTSHREIFAYKLYKALDRIRPSFLRGKAKALREILVCPLCKASFRWESNRVECVACGAAYACSNGVPILNKPLRK